MILNETLITSIGPGWFWSECHRGKGSRFVDRMRGNQLAIAGHLPHWWTGHLSHWWAGYLSYQLVQGVCGPGGQDLVNHSSMVGKAFSPPCTGEQGICPTLYWWMGHLPHHALVGMAFVPPYTGWWGICPNLHWWVWHLPHPPLAQPQHLFAEHLPHSALVARASAPSVGRATTSPCTIVGRASVPPWTGEYGICPTLHWWVGHLSHPTLVVGRAHPTLICGGYNKLNIQIN